MYVHVQPGRYLTYVELRRHLLALLHRETRIHRHPPRVHPIQGTTVRHRERCENMAAAIGTAGHADKQGDWKKLLEPKASQ